jgi:hypothetical protein
MLPNYDFSNGVRGKYRDRNLSVPLPGVQFLKNSRGQKTAVLLDLQIHRDLWQKISSQNLDLTDFQYLTNTQNHTQSVFLDFKTNLPLWQTIYDRIIAESIR